MDVEEIKKVIEEKVIGKVFPRHDDFGHHYELSSGRIVDSVTTKIILNKPHLTRWAIKIAIEWLEQKNRWTYLTRPELRSQYLIGAQTAYTEVRDDAGQVGTIAHDAIERYIKKWIITGEKPADIREFFVKGDDLRAVASARSAENVFRTHDIVPIASELLVGSSKYKVAGTLDFLCLWDGNLTVADFKTSNQVSDDYAMQVAAYLYLFQDMTGIKPTQAKILHLSKDSDKYTLYRIPNLAAAFKAYRGLTETYDWLNNLQPKLSKDVKSITL